MSETRPTRYVLEGDSSGLARELVQAGQEFERLQQKVDATEAELEKLRQTQKKTGAEGKATGGALAQAWGTASTAAKGVGAAVVVAGAAIFGAVKAVDLAKDSVLGLAEGTRTAVSRLSELDGVEGPNPKAREGVERFDQAMLGLEAAGLEVVQTLGAELLPVFADLVEHGTAVLEVVDDGIDEFYEFAHSIEEYTRVANAALSLGFSEGFRLLHTEIATAGDEITETKVSTQKFGDVLGGLTKIEENVITLTKTGSAARKQWAADSKKAAEEVADAQEDLHEILFDSAEDQMSDQARIRHEYDEQIAKIAELEKISGDHATADAARTAATLRMRRDVVEAEKEQAEELADLLKQEQEAKDEAYEDEVARIKQLNDAQYELASAVTDGLGQTLDAVLSLAEEGTAAYTALFVGRQVAALASATVNTAEGITAALALPPPAGEIAAAARGVLGAAQIATIAATTVGGLTKEHGGSSGLAPDEQLVVKLRGEQTLDPATSAAIGGGAGARRLAQGGGSGGGAVESYVRWRNKTFRGPLEEMQRSLGSGLFKSRNGGKRVGQRPRPQRNRVP